MGVYLAGAHVEISADLGDPTLVLGRDLVGDVMNGPDAILSDITDLVIIWRQRWGAPDPLGPLTEVRTGRVDVRLWDPDRRFDPTNDAPGSIRIAFGAEVELRVDGALCFRGTLEGSYYSHMDGIASWVLGDGIGRLQASTDTIELDAGTTFAQAEAVLDQAGVPASRQVYIGSPIASRTATDPEVRSFWSALRDIRNAELGDLWVDRRGRVCFRGRQEAPDPEIKATIGAGGIACDGLFESHDRRALVTGVNVTMELGTVRSWADSGAEAEHNARRRDALESVIRLDA